MTNLKYEMTSDDTISHRGRTLHRIRALRDFGDVTAGDLGGYVESESNLSHDGDAWIYGGKVLRAARVKGAASIHGGTFRGGEFQGDVTRDPIHITGLRWPVTICDTVMTIGCVTHGISE